VLRRPSEPAAQTGHVIFKPFVSTRCGAREASWRCRGYRGEELDGDTALAIIEQLDANDLADVFAVAEAGGRVIGECDEETHAFLVVLALGEEVESFARDIPRGADFFEEFGARTARTDLHRLADCYSAAPAMVYVTSVLHKTITPCLDRKRHKSVLNRTASSRKAQITLFSRICH